jgi:hypothetical protein
MSIQGPSPLLRDAGAPALTMTPIEAPPPIRPSLPAAPAPAAPDGTATVSPWAALLSKLQHLQQSSPPAFNRVVGQMADTVDSEARKATGAEAQSLSGLRDQLKQVAKTGDLSVFRPTHHQRHARTMTSGSAPSMLQRLLEQVDHVLGPGATPA